MLHCCELNTFTLRSNTDAPHTINLLEHVCGQNVWQSCHSTSSLATGNSWGEASRNLSFDGQDCSQTSSSAAARPLVAQTECMTIISQLVTHISTETSYRCHSSVSFQIYDKSTIWASPCMPSSTRTTWELKFQTQPLNSIQWPPINIQKDKYRVHR